MSRPRLAPLTIRQGDDWGDTFGLEASEALTQLEVSAALLPRGWGAALPLLASVLTPLPAQTATVALAATALDTAAWPEGDYLLRRRIVANGHTLTHGDVPVTVLAGLPAGGAQ